MGFFVGEKPNKFKGGVVNMWVRFNGDISNNERKGDTVWVEDDKAAEKAIAKGLVTRCTGPDGIAFGEAFPEDVEKHLKKDAERKAKLKKK